MTRRLLGYVVKFPGGSRHKDTPEPLPFKQAAGKISAARAPARMAGGYVVPVFSKPKPKPAPVEAGETPAAIYVVVSASHGGALTTTMTMFADEAERDRAASVAAGDSTSRVMRYVPENAHEAAVKEAREQGRAEGLHEARRTLLDLADDFAGDHAAGLRHAVRCVYDMIQATKEAAKAGGS